MEKFISGMYISRVHGQPRFITWESNEFFLFPMYHPAAALRNPHIKKDFYQDFKHLRHCLDKPPQTTPTTKPIATQNKDHQDKQTKLF